MFGNQQAASETFHRLSDNLQGPPVFSFLPHIENICLNASVYWSVGRKENAQ